MAFARDDYGDYERDYAPSGTGGGGSYFGSPNYIPSAPGTDPSAPGYSINNDPGYDPPPGVTPPPGMMWSREMANWVPDPNYQAPGGGGGGGGGGGEPPVGPISGLLNPYGGPGMPSVPSGTSYIPQTPNYTAPTFKAPTYKPPPAFELPTFEQAANDPGYQFTRRQGQQGLEQSAAARGLLNTGGTAKGLIDYNQAAANTQYGNVLNRLLNQYMTNYQTQTIDPYNIAFQGAQAEFAPQMAQFQANVGAGNLGYSTQAAAGQRGQEFNYDALWNQYLQNVNNFRDQRDSTFGKTFQYLTAE